MATELLTTTEIAGLLGVNVKSADKQLRRWGISPTARQPGRGGQNLYDADSVRSAVSNRPGKGFRSDLRREKAS